MPEKILIVDDEVDMLELLKRIIENKTPYRVVTTPDPLEVPRLLDETPFDLLITDLRMPGQGGIELLETVRQKHEQLPIIVITAYGTIESAVEAMQRLKNENLSLRQVLDDQVKYPFLIGGSPVMEKVYQRIQQVARTSATILITGESGTGKELAAKTIHYHSQRKDKGFVAVNCSALPETLIESELFGHLKGSFTGAIRDKKGLVEEADGGTLFLDEIGDLNLIMQTKLLRLLQEGEYKPVGSSKTLTADVRFIAATNMDLIEKVRKKEFREDLYYRLNVIQITMPPLRDRREDIVLLTRHFMEKFIRINQKTIKGITPEALDGLMARDWPGNIRELENVIERGVILTASDLLQVFDLFPADQPTPFIFDIREDVFQAPFKDAKERLISDFHAEYIRRVLSRVGGNVSLAAKECGLKRPYLHRLMKEHDIKAKSFRRSE
jgi:DNA-binding NtrC family response regulator